MIVKLRTEHHLEFLSLKEEAQTRLSLHLSKCQIVGNLMPRLICNLKHWTERFVFVHISDTVSRWITGHSERLIENTR